MISPYLKDNIIIKYQYGDVKLVMKTVKVV